jgi:hypothetical protein
MLPSLQSAFGILVFLALVWLLSEDRARLPWRTLFAGIGLQFVLAAALLWLPLFKQVFIGLNDVLLSLEQATRAGTSFVFGYLGGDRLPFDEIGSGSSFILAFRALPLILLVSALSALLFYWGILPLVVRTLSRLLQRVMGIGGALGLGVVTNIFVGMVEAPLFVRPYLKEMTRSELFTLMTTGMATVAGTMMVLYASILGEVLPDAMGHVLIASLISAPAAIVIAQMLVPPELRATAGELAPPDRATGSMACYRRCAPDLAAHAGLAAGAGRLVDGHPLGTGACRWRAAGYQDHPQRIYCLPGSCGPASRSVEPAQPADHGLRTVRICQLRQSGDYDRRPGYHGPRTACGDRGAGDKIHHRRNPGNLHDRCCGGRALLNP